MVKLDNGRLCADHVPFEIGARPAWMRCLVCCALMLRAPIHCGDDRTTCWQYFRGHKRTSARLGTKKKHSAVRLSESAATSLATLMKSR